MKKKYLKLKVKLTVIVVFVLLLGCGVLTYQKANQIKEDYLDDIREHSGFDDALRWNNAMESDDFLQQVYLEYHKALHGSNIGFYSMLKDANGNTLAEDQNCIIVQKADESTLPLDQHWDPVDSEDVEEDRKILLLGDDFGCDPSEEDDSQWSFLNYFFLSMEIIGTCDDTYIYLEELKWTNTLGDESYSYIPKDQWNSENKGTIKFEDWTGSRYYGDWPIKHKYNIWINSTCFPYGDWENNKKLNEEAKEICEEIYADFASGIDTKDDQSKHGLFTCYFASSGWVNDEYVMPYVYVFHPVSIAIEELSGIFFYASIFGMVVIVFICAVINKLYEQQLAYETNRRELTRGIAHELKTPLAITRGYIENWEYLEDKDRQESAQIMIDEIEHMNRMVTDLLELSHLEAKAKKINPESVDVYALTGSVLKRMKGIIEERGLVVNKNADKEKAISGEFIVEADLEMMRTVLVNFVSNAVKYADKEINIDISVHGRKIRFTINNDGMAIASDKIEKVWDEFYRDETIDSSRIGGSGLGLAITKNILILHGARYGCKCEDGKTSFWFEMKRVNGEDI